MEVRKTDDGSLTLYTEKFNETYHSVNGAVTESKHVFINSGFNVSKVNPCNILEIGFGTGLNTYLTLLEAMQNNINVNYTALELYPVSNEIINIYVNQYKPEKPDVFKQIHSSSWRNTNTINSNFVLHKVCTDFLTFNYPINSFDVVYFDAFSPNVQPELWTVELFTQIYSALKTNGILTTYCAKGQVRRNMQACGFVTERLPGPPGKREILRAFKK